MGYLMRLELIRKDFGEIYVVIDKSSYFEAALWPVWLKLTREQKEILIVIYTDFC